MRLVTPIFLSLCLALPALAQRADPSFDPKKDVTLVFQKGAVVVIRLK